MTRLGGHGQAEGRLRGRAPSGALLVSTHEPDVDGNAAAGLALRGGRGTEPDVELFGQMGRQGSRGCALRSAPSPRAAGSTHPVVCLAHAGQREMMMSAVAFRAVPSPPLRQMRKGSESATLLARGEPTMAPCRVVTYFGELVFKSSKMFLGSCFQ